MFFDDAAAGAQRKRGRLVGAFGAQYGSELKWRMMGCRIVGRKVNQHRVALDVGTNQECRVRLVSETRVDLSRQVHAHVEDLVRIGQHQGKGSSEFELNRNPGSPKQKRGGRKRGGCASNYMILREGFV